MGTVYTKVGNTFRLSSDRALDVHKELPAGTYALKFHPELGFFLEEIANYELPSKVYGEANKNAERIFSTFMNRTVATGVLLHGEKGSGKTLLVKMLSEKARQNGMPTIVINNSEFFGESFNTLIQSISQRALVIFDEFEKVYDDERQEKMLTLLDGVYPTPKLFLLTCNDVFKVSKFMQNRPGRVYYSIGYDTLSGDFIREYCEDNLKNKKYVPQVVRLRSVFWKMNFDMLKALVEEMNRYDESPEQALGILNVKPELKNSRFYNIVLTRDGVKLTVQSSSAQFTPTLSPSTIHFVLSRPAKKGETKNEEGLHYYINSVTFEPADIVAVTDDGDFQFEKDGFVATLTLFQATTYDYFEPLSRTIDHERVFHSPKKSQAPTPASDLADSSSRKRWDKNVMAAIEAINSADEDEDERTGEGDCSV